MCFVYSEKKSFASLNFAEQKCSQKTPHFDSKKL